VPGAFQVPGNPGPWSAPRKAGRGLFFPVKAGQGGKITLPGSAGVAGALCASQGVKHVMRARYFSARAYALKRHSRLACVGRSPMHLHPGTIPINAHSRRILRRRVVKYFFPCRGNACPSWLRLV